MMRARFAFATARGDYAAGERFLDALKANSPPNAFWREQNANDEAALVGVQGKLSRAEELFRASAAAAEERGVPTDYLAEHALLAQMEARERNRPERGREVLAAALAKHPLASMSTLDRPYVLLASTYAIVGRPEE